MPKFEVAIDHASKYEQIIYFEAIKVDHYPFDAENLDAEKIIIFSNNGSLTIEFERPVRVTIIKERESNDK